MGKKSRLKRERREIRTLGEGIMMNDAMRRYIQEHGLPQNLQDHFAVIHLDISLNDDNTPNIRIVNGN